MYIDGRFVRKKALVKFLKLTRGLSANQKRKTRAPQAAEAISVRAEKGGNFAIQFYQGIETIYGREKGKCPVILV